MEEEESCPVKFVHIKRGEIFFCVRQTRVSNETTTGHGDSNTWLGWKLNRPGSAQARTLCTKTCLKIILKSKVFQILKRKQLYNLSKQIRQGSRMKREITSIQHPTSSYHSDGTMKGSKGGVLGAKNGHCAR